MICFPKQVVIRCLALSNAEMALWALQTLEELLVKCHLFKHEKRPLSEIKRLYLGTDH